MAQPTSKAEATDLSQAVDICTSLEDARRALRALKECEIDRRELDLVRQQSALKSERIATLEKEIELLKRESEIKDRIIQVKEMEIAAQVRALQDMKEITDRAIKLAEASRKTGPGWELQGLLGLAAFVLGFLTAR